MICRRFLSLCIAVVTTTTLVTTVALVLRAAFTIPTFNYLCLLSVIILYVFFLVLTYCLCSRYVFGGRIQPENKAVLITGCDSGFGYELARRLDSKGFQVFACCLFPEGPGATDLKINCSDRLQVLYLDVTKDESVEQAVNYVKRNLGVATLWAIVNNAGIYKGFAIEFTPIEAFRQCFEINSLGPVRVTKAFLPLLRKWKGRVVNVTSLGGRVCLIGTCAYTMSKYAAVAFTESLSLEMKAWGVPVISIEPETFRTPMSNPQENLFPAIDEDVRKVDEEILAAYGEDYVDGFKQFALSYTGLAPSGVHIVIDALESAVMDLHPYHAYKPRWNFITRLVCFFSEMIPYELFEFLQLKSVGLLRYPIPKHVKKGI